MGFKENLLKKIRIDELTRKAINSWGPPDSGKRLDTSIVKTLLEMTEYEHHRERDLDLYISPGYKDGGDILVLDNELKFYHTSIEDVGMRKSPTVKEMVSIRNAIKILNDKDIVTSSKAESMTRLHKELVDQLDLSYAPEDIEALAREGMASLENNYTDGIFETLSIFAELLDFNQAPRAFKAEHFRIVGYAQSKRTGEVEFGPALAYSLMHNDLLLIDRNISSFDKAAVQLYHDTLKGAEEPSARGNDVFEFLKSAVLDKK